MSFCTSCGAQLGFGRFCTNCGAPINSAPPAADPTDTQVRLPAVQPDAASGPRFPLYAEPTAPAPASPQPRPTDRRGSGSPVLVWVLCLVLLAVLGGVGTWWLTRDDGTDGRPDTTASADRGGEDTPVVPGTPPPPDGAGTDPEPSDPGDAVDLTSEVDVEAPPAAPPGQAVDGSPVTYPPSNMLDGDPTTAYRITGNAAGSEIVFSLPGEAVVHEVGLVNGYAKVDGTGANRNDWYASNRKVLEVEWIFDDGTVVPQSLNRTTDMQVVPVDGVRTSTVRLRLVKVSKPGPNPRNTTAISSVRIQGSR